MPMLLKWFPGQTVGSPCEEKPQVRFLDCDFRDGFVDSQALREQSRQ